jgi:hypothetical protein
VALVVSFIFFREEEGITFLLGIVFLFVGGALGAWSFMLFVQAAQLA